MIGTVVLRHPGQKLLDPNEATRLMHEYFYSEEHIRHVWGTPELFTGFLIGSLLQPTVRAEGYIHDEHGRIMASVMMSKMYSLHYGVYGEMVFTYVSLPYRDCPEVLRGLANLRKNTAEKLGVTHYNVVKHISEHTTVHRMRTV